MEFPTNISMSINDHLPSSNDLHSRSRVFSGIIMRYVPGREGEREGVGWEGGDKLSLGNGVHMIGYRGNSLITH